MGEATPIGTVEMSYLIQPLDLHGRPINGGNHYANASTEERAREVAARWLKGGEHLGYTLGGVYVSGREMRLGYQAWEELPGGRVRAFTVTREDAGEPPVWMNPAETYCWDTTVLDYPERVHAMRSDGTCRCGNPQAGYGGLEPPPGGTTSAGGWG